MNNYNNNNSNILGIVVGILLIIVIALAGYIVYDKLVVENDSNPVITKIDKQNVDLNIFNNIVDITKMLDNAYNDSSSEYLGYIYNKDLEDFKNFDKNAALFAALYNEIHRSNTVEYIRGGIIKENLKKIFGRDMAYKPPQVLSAGSKYAIGYDENSRVFAYQAPLKQAYESEYRAVSTRTILTDDEIRVTRKIFFVDFNLNSENNYVSASIYFDHSKQKKIGTISLRDGALVTDEVVQKYGSKCKTLDYVFKKSSSKTYYLGSIQEIEK